MLFLSSVRCLILTTTVGVLAEFIVWKGDWGITCAYNLLVLIEDHFFNCLRVPHDTATSHHRVVVDHPREESIVVKWLCELITNVFFMEPFLLLWSLILKTIHLRLVHLSVYGPMWEWWLSNETFTFLKVQLDQLALIFIFLNFEFKVNITYFCVVVALLKHIQWVFHVMVLESCTIVESRTSFGNLQIRH